MKPRILLVNPWVHDFAAFNLWARPLGLLKVIEYLSAFDVELLFIDCMDFFEPSLYGVGKYRSETIRKPEILKNVPRHFKRYGMGVDEFKARLHSCRPLDVVLMTSIMTYWYPGVQETVRHIRESAGAVPVMLGGIYPTIYPDHASINSGVDRTWVGPLDDRFHSALGNFGLALSPVRRPQSYTTLNLYSRQPFAPLLTSAGCPYHCSYCASRSLYPAYRRRPMTDVIEEIVELAGRGVRDFAFYDDALLFDPGNHIKPLLEEIIRKRLGIRLHAPNGLHARFIDGELAELMSDAGFKTIRLSLETVDRERQEMTGGKVFTSDLEASVRRLQKHGFAKEHIGVYLLYGLPGQGLDEVREGIKFLKRLSVRIYLAEFSPIKGTGCWDDLVKSRLIPADLDPLLTNNTIFSFIYSGYNQADVERIKIDVKEYNSRQQHTY